MRIVIVGAGAAGCFAAITLKRECPMAEITVLERGTRALAKVAITGGGRCNLTNSFARVNSLDQVYPRGYRLMKRLFHQFSHEDTYQWFEQENVKLITQEDECVFPRSQQAMEIVNTLLGMMRDLGVKLITQSRVTSIEQHAEGYLLHTVGATHLANKLLICTGGQPKINGYDMLDAIPLKTEYPVPSLFSLCINETSLTDLMGLVVKDVRVGLTGTKLQAEGTILITHWGVSGPAILRLSSYAARQLAECDYKATLYIRWMGDSSQDEVQEMLEEMVQANRNKLMTSAYPRNIQSRLWAMLLSRSGIPNEQRWGDLQKKSLNRLVNVLTNDTYQIVGKNRFKEEFVTCGGIALSELSPCTLEAKKYPGLYFAGEVTDVDAVTGGFNLQAAWTMGYVAAKSIAQSITNNN